MVIFVLENVEIMFFGGCVYWNIFCVWDVIGVLNFLLKIYWKLVSCVSLDLGENWIFWGLILWMNIIMLFLVGKDLYIMRFVEFYWRGSWGVFFMWWIFCVWFILMRSEFLFYMSFGGGGVYRSVCWFFCVMWSVSGVVYVNCDRLLNWYLSLFFVGNFIVLDVCSKIKIFFELNVMMFLMWILCSDVFLVFGCDLCC